MNQWNTEKKRISTVLHITNRLISGSIFVCFLLFIQGSKNQCLALNPDFLIEDNVVKEYNGTDRGIRIDEGITEIDAGAFSGNEEIVSVTLPSTLEKIGIGAFEGCTSLVYINLPDGLQTIGNGAFKNCGQLAEIVMPNSVTSIGTSAFSGCTSLSAVKLSAGLTAIPENAFSSCKSLSYVTVPSGVTEIGKAAFSQCDMLLGISLPDTVTTIKSGAFSSDKNLLYLQIPKDVTTIENATCASTRNLYALEIPAGVTSIGQNVIITEIYNVDNVQTIYFKGTQKQWNSLSDHIDSATLAAMNRKEIKVKSSLPQEDQILVSIPSGFSAAGSINKFGDGGFIIEDGVLIEYKGSGGEVVVPEGVTYIASGAFKGKESVTKVTLPDGVYGIGANAFENCKNLTQVSMPDSVTYIGRGAFSGCKSLTAISLPDGIFEICPKTFIYCESLQSIQLPRDLVQIGEEAFMYTGLQGTLTLPQKVLLLDNYAFSGCYKLKGCKLPDTLRSVGDYTFYLDQELEEISFGDNTKNIGTNAFRSCFDLINVKLPAGLRKLHADVFRNCNDLRYLTIPDGVTEIESMAFAGSGISAITLPAGLKELESNVFYECNDLKVISIPEGVTTLGNWLFSECYHLETVFIPDSVTKIPDSIFDGCRNLKNVYYQGTAEKWDQIGGNEAIANLPDGVNPSPATGSDPAQLADELTVYHITYDLGDGGMPLANPQAYTKADGDIKVERAWLDGYYFKGWELNGVWTGQTEVTIPSGSTGDKHFKAVWLKVYKITYEYNGGNASNPFTYKDEDPDFTLNNPTKFEGFDVEVIFLGWTGSNGQVPQKDVTVKVADAENKHYEAHWARKFKITYDLDGGRAPSGSYPDTYLDTDDDITIPDPVKDGGEFLGWYIDDSNDLVTNFVIPKGSTGNLKLIAVWKDGKYDSDVYTITYELDGGTATGNPDTYTSNDPDIHINKPQKENYWFYAWTITGGQLTGTERDAVIPHGSRGDLTFSAYFIECDHEVDNTLPQKDPTCTEAGYEEGTCCLCEKIKNPGKTIAALGHDFDYNKGVITKEPTATQTGIRTYTCTRCGAKEEEEIPALGGGQNGAGQGNAGNGQDGGQTVSGNTTGAEPGTGSGNGSGNGDTTQQQATEKIGSTFTKGKGVYQITKTGKNPEVTFLRPAGKKKTSISIPATVKYSGVTYKVTAIGPKAVKNNTNVTKIEIGKNIKKLPDRLFNGCSKLKTVKILGKKTKLGKKLFDKKCAKIKTVYFSGLKFTKSTFSKNTFKGLRGKVTIKVKANKADYKKITKAIKNSGAPKSTKYKRVK